MNIRIPPILLALALTATASAQQAKPNNGRIVGVLRDAWCKTGVAKAAITIKGAKLKRKLKSDTEGKFSILLPPGIYQITIEKYGFKRYIVSEVKVTADTALPVTADMEYGWSTDDPNNGKPQPCAPPNNSFRPERRERVS